MPGCTLGEVQKAGSVSRCRGSCVCRTWLLTLTGSLTLPSDAVTKALRLVGAAIWSFFLTFLALIR